MTVLQNIPDVNADHAERLVELFHLHSLAETMKCGDLWELRQRQPFIEIPSLYEPTDRALILAGWVSLEIHAMGPVPGKPSRVRLTNDGYDVAVTVLASLGFDAEALIEDLRSGARHPLEALANR